MARIATLARSRWLGWALVAVVALLAYGAGIWHDGGLGTNSALARARTEPQLQVALQDLNIGPVLQYANATYTGSPQCIEIMVPSLNPTVPQFVCDIVRRPESGGGLYVLTLLTANGTLQNIFLNQASYQDCFGGAPWASRFTGTIKVYLNCKTPNDPDGNKRDIFPIDTGIPAAPVGP